MARCIRSKENISAFDSGRLWAYHVSKVHSWSRYGPDKTWTEKRVYDHRSARGHRHHCANRRHRLSGVRQQQALGSENELRLKLRQIGQALSLYRDEYGGAESGTPSSMGLPPDLGPLHVSVRCQGIDPLGQGRLGYYITWPNDADIAASPRIGRFWAWYTNRFGPGSIVVYCPFHQPDAGLKSLSWEMWTVLGLRLDGSVLTRTHLGFPHLLQWWHQ